MSSGLYVFFLHCAQPVWYIRVQSVTIRMRSGLFCNLSQPSRSRLELRFYLGYSRLVVQTFTKRTSSCAIQLIFFVILITSAISSAPEIGAISGREILYSTLLLTVASVLWCLSDSCPLPYDVMDRRSTPPHYDQKHRGGRAPLALLSTNPAVWNHNAARRPSFQFASQLAT